MAIVAVVAFNMDFGANKNLSEIYLANVEALADNEPKDGLNCLGLLGWCSFNCSHCSASLNALGSTFVNNHKCTQN